MTVEFLIFEQYKEAPERKTVIVDVWNKDHSYQLGQIRWRSGWRKYVFSICEDADFDDICLLKIVLKLKELDAHQKLGWKK